MSSNKYILAIDQGTSSTKTLIFDQQGKAIAKGVEPLETFYFGDGYVEQDPEAIYQNVLQSARNCFEKVDVNTKKEIVSIGISNQRETFVVWDKEGKPLHRAVVWQCKRSFSICERLKQQGLTDMVTEKTGLLIDPYFSATKLLWLKENIPSISKAFENGEAFFGTIDCWLLYQMTNGASYQTDYTNASRTLLFNLHTLGWDEELVNAFGLQGIRLPGLQASSSFFGKTDLDGLLENFVAITGMIGDSHAAAFGEGCFEAGTAKATVGTGCSILMNVGTKPVASKNGMVSTICWSTEDKVSYALEGVIVSCGATIEWLKNELGLFSSSNETMEMAETLNDNGGVYLVPAFSGLGSPHWQMERRASISGLTFSTTKNHIVRAALESIPYQIKDVITAMEKDSGVHLKQLMIDGGITANQFVMSFISGLLNKNIVSIGMADVSALGAALIAGLKSGMYENLETLQQLNTEKKIFAPANQDAAAKAHEGWLKAINGS